MPPKTKEEKPEQPDQPTTSQKIKVGETEYTPEELQKAFLEAEHLRNSFGKLPPEVIEMGQHVASALSRGVDGMKQLKKELEDALAERGVDADVNNQKAGDLPTFDLPDKSNATENEVAIINALNKIAELHNNTAKSNQSLREELQRQFSSLMVEIKTNEVATSAQVQVQKETGLSLTPAEIREAIRKTGLNNPVDAVFAIPEYRAKAIEKLKVELHGKPEAKTLEMMGGDPNRNFNPTGKSFSELLEYAEQNPEAMKDYLPPWQRKK